MATKLSGHGKAMKIKIHVLFMDTNGSGSPKDTKNRNLNKNSNNVLLPSIASVPESGVERTFQKSWFDSPAPSG